MQNINLGDFTLLERIMLPTVRVNYVMNTNLILNSALQAEGRKNRAVDDGKEEEKGRDLPFALAIWSSPLLPARLTILIFYLKFGIPKGAPTEERIS